MDTLKVSISQDNAWPIERQVTTVEKKATPKMYVEAPLNQSDPSHIEADPYVKYDKLVIRVIRNSEKKV